MSNKFYNEFRSETRRALSKSGCPFSLIEGFAGPGGMSLGLQRAGFNMMYAFDVDTKSVETHNLNLGDHAETRDVKEVSAEELRVRFVGSEKQLDLFAGGPPCQGFSKQKRGAHLGDNRNDLIYEYIRLVNDLQPKFFFFENVAIFGQKRGRKFIEAMHASFKDYAIHAYFLNSANFGLAQTRQRFVIVGKHVEIASPFILPEKIVDSWTTLADAIGDLPPPPDDYSEHELFPNHQKARVTEINVKRFACVPPGGGWQDIPYEMRLPCHQKVDPSKGGWPDVFGRLKWEGQCPTITGGFDSFTRGRYGHPAENRPITPREAARLQGFPDAHVFQGTRGNVRSQIGNAVPPPLAEAVGTSILRTLLIENGCLKPKQPEEVLLEQSAKYL